MRNGNDYMVYVPYRFNKRKSLWLKIITNPWFMVAVFLGGMATCILSESL